LSEFQFFLIATGTFAVVGIIIYFLWSQLNEFKYSAKSVKSHWHDKISYAHYVGRELNEMEVDALRKEAEQVLKKRKKIWFYLWLKEDVKYYEKDTKEFLERLRERKYEILQEKNPN